MPTFTLQQRNHELDQHNAETLIRIANETGDTPIEPQTPSRLGDERQLRGIPAIGRGITGAITGTNPGR